jgi:hypothetical protein
VILDDPLSALDAEVGRKVFEDCILGAMRGGQTEAVVVAESDGAVQIARVSW